jgi:Flp pilus assembly CpaE family ATPase
MLERVRAVVEPRARAIVVTAPSGGVGATSVALHLASTITGSCLVDLGGHIAERLNLGPEDVRTWDQEDDVGSLTFPGGVRVALAPADPARDAMRAALARAMTTFDQIVVDAPAADALEVAIDVASTVVLVMSPTKPGAYRARRLLDLHPHRTWAIVANRVGPGGETTRSDLEAILERRLAIELPCCPSLRDAEDDGRLLSTTWTRWTRGIRRLAQVLV